MTSNDDVDPDLIPIGEAARRLGLRTSALRYYDDRGLVTPAARVAGRRMYGADELRRVAFLTLAQRLGIPLGTAVGVLDAPGPQWRADLRDQITAVDRLIEQARGRRCSSATPSSAGRNTPLGSARR